MRRMRTRRGRFVCRIFPWLCSDPPEVPEDPPPQGDRAAAAMAATNEQRENAGLPPVQPHSCLASQAQQWAEEMHRRGVMSHEGFSGRLRACQIGAGSENVAAGYPTGSSVVAGWMGSPGHRQNILGNFSHCGVGVSGDYWCQLFGREI